MINLGFKRQHQLAEKLKTFFPNETSRKAVKILDVAAGTGLQGVPTQTFILHFALADRNMQVRFRLKVF